MSDYGRMMRFDSSGSDRRETAQASRDTARATKESRELIEQLVEHAITTAEATDVRERQMLRWTQAGVALSAIAAVASIIAIVVTVVVGG